MRYLSLVSGLNDWKFFLSSKHLRPKKRLNEGAERIKR